MFVFVEALTILVDDNVIGYGKTMIGGKKELEEQSDKSRKSYYLIWCFIVFIPVFFGILQILAIVEVISLGWHGEPAFWAGAIVWAITGYFYHDILIWLRKKPIIIPVLVWVFLTLLYYLGRTGKFPIVIQFMMWGGLGPVMAGVRAFREEGFMGYGGKKTKGKKPRREKTTLRVTKGGSDRPWPGGWIYRLRKPIQRIFIRRFNENIRLLSKAIGALTNGANTLFYCPFEPPNGEPEIFDKTMKFASEHNVPCQVYMEKHGMLKRLFTGEDESTGALAVDCRSPEVLEWILDHYWTGDFCCWFLAHKGSFQSAAERMHRTLNPETFPDGFKELVMDSYVFMRDIEEGEALELITANLAREDVQQRVSIVNAETRASHRS